MLNSTASLFDCSLSVRAACGVQGWESPGRSTIPFHCLLPHLVASWLLMNLVLVCTHSRCAARTTSGSVRTGGGCWHHSKHKHMNPGALHWKEDRGVTVQRSLLHQGEKLSLYLSVCLSVDWLFWDGCVGLARALLFSLACPDSLVRHECVQNTQPCIFKPLFLTKASEAYAFHVNAGDE